MKVELKMSLDLPEIYENSPDAGILNYLHLDIFSRAAMSCHEHIRHAMTSKDINDELREHLISYYNEVLEVLDTVEIEIEHAYGNYCEFGLDVNRITRNPEDGSIDYNGNVDLRNKNLTEIPFNFRYVLGDFFCSDNNLTSLKGAPRKVNGDFYCYDNDLTTLEGAPQRVGGYFDCGNNNLTCFKGAPQKVGGNFYCNGNPNLPQSEKDWVGMNAQFRGNIVS